MQPLFFDLSILMNSNLWGKKKYVCNILISSHRLKTSYWRRQRGCEHKTALWHKKGSVSRTRSDDWTRWGLTRFLLEQRGFECDGGITAALTCFLQALEEALKTTQPLSVSSGTLQDVWKHQVSFVHISSFCIILLFLANSLLRRSQMWKWSCR